MIAHQFVSMVTFHNHVILQLLPGHPIENAAINDEDFKSLIFESMPIKWKNSYEEHHSPYEDTLTQIVTRIMEIYQNKENKKSKKNNQDNSSPNRNNNNNNSNNNINNNCNNSNSCNNNQNNRNGNNRNNNQSKNNNRQNRQQDSNNSQGNNNNNPSTRVSYTSPCPIHSNTNHTWGQCYLNANNPNQPNRNNNNNNNNDAQVNDHNFNSNFNSNNSNQSSNSSSYGNNAHEPRKHMCVFINQPEETPPPTEPWPDLFHVDMDVDTEYCNLDLQRFLEATQTLDSHNNDSNVAPSNNKDVDLALTTASVCHSINGTSRKCYLKTLFDSGSTNNLLVKSSIPSGVTNHSLVQPIQIQTTNGRATCNHYVILENIMFPELSYSMRVLKIKCFVVTENVNYHLLIGTIIMRDLLGMEMDFEACTIKWNEKTMHFHPQNYFDNKALLHKVMSAEPHSVAGSYSNQVAQQAYANGTTKYEKTDLHKLVSEQEHLSDHEKSCLLKILLENEELFKGLNDNRLGIFPDQEFHIDLQQDAKPYHIKQPYPIPLHQQEDVKKEID